MASVKVVVRVRPFNERELNMTSKCIIKMENNKTIIFNQKGLENNNNASEMHENYKTFTYDHSYWSFDNKDNNFATQEKVFLDLGKGVIDCAFEGYNACVFAYGQTGSGKSFSMMGQTGTKNEGLIPRICKGLFENMKNDVNRDHNFRTEISYLEIYNEKVRDLLRVTSKHNLKVREHPIEGPFVEDLSKHIVLNYDDIEELMNRGNDNRTTAATSMNDVSSRSHAIFTIKFVQTKIVGNISCETVSKIHLVDLAGSERADSTNTVGIRLVEGGNINKSLLTLINVISTLSDNSLDENRNKKLYIPYRDSVLTWLLKDSLGGNSKTVMVATISPACVNYSETLNTLRYANRAKSIINKPTVNEDQNVKLIRELRAEIDRLKSLLEKGDSTIEEKEVNLNDINLTSFSEYDKWECKWKDYHELFDEDDHCLELIRKERKSLTILSKQYPYLIGFDDDVSSNSGLNFVLLHPGKTSMGTENTDIILVNDKEFNVDKEHCHLINDNFNVTLHPLNDSKCFLNGKIVDKAAKLVTGSIIMIGKRNFFRFNNPHEISDLANKDIIIESSFIFEAIKKYFGDEKNEEIKETLEKTINNLNEKIDKEKTLLLNQIKEYEAKFSEQQKQSQQLSWQNEEANNQIKLLNNDLKTILNELNDLKQKSLNFEIEKNEYLMEKEKIEEQKASLERSKKENEKQSLSLQTNITELNYIKNVYNELTEQIRKEKFLIEKEITEYKKKMALKTEKINEQPFQVVNTDTKSSINKENREILEDNSDFYNVITNEENLETINEFLNKYTKLIKPTKNFKYRPNLNLT